MKSLKFLYIALLIMFTTLSAQEKNELKVFNMSNFEIDSLLTEVSKKQLTITEKMKYFSGLFLDTPYDLTCTGDGPYALYEPKPLVNFKETNCMVYCEHVLAMSVSDSWDNFFNNLQQIRYKDGIIGMRSRNHYTMGDWLPENEWLLHDVTKLIGGEKVKTTVRTISHEEFFKGKGISDLRYVKPDRKITRYFIPFDELLAVKNNIKDGDVLSLFIANKENIFSAHMLMAYWIEGELFLRESAMSKKTTFDTKFEDWVNKYLNSTRYDGLAFMRVNENLNTPGKIILPWKISEIKKQSK